MFCVRGKWAFVGVLPYEGRSGRTEKEEKTRSLGKRERSAIIGSGPEPTRVMEAQASIPVNQGWSILNPEAREFVTMGLSPLQQRPAKIRKTIDETADEVTTGVYRTNGRNNYGRDDSIQLTPLLRFKIQLDSKETLAIMDSGSQYCIIGENLLKEIANPEITSRLMKLRGIGDPSHCTESQRTATLRVTIYGIGYGRFEFIVVKYLKEGVILGMPFLTKNQIKLNVAEKTFTRYGETGIIEHVHLPTDPGNCVRVVTALPVYVVEGIAIIEDGCSCERMLEVGTDHT